MEFKCNCHNSGTNSFTGKCDRCGMIKSMEIDTHSIEGQVELRLEDIKRKILESVIENTNEYGDVVMLSDILPLFSAKNK